MYLFECIFNCDFKCSCYIFFERKKNVENVDLSSDQTSRGNCYDRLVCCYCCCDNKGVSNVAYVTQCTHNIKCKVTKTLVSSGLPVGLNQVPHLT